MREQIAAKEALGHAREHDRLESLHDQVKALRREHLARGQERVAALEENAAEADRRTIKDAGARLGSVEQNLRDHLTAIRKLEGNVPAELAPRLLALEESVGRREERLDDLVGSAAHVLSGHLGVKRRVEVLEAGVLPDGLQRFTALEEGRHLQAGTIESHSKRLESLELNAAGYEKQLGRLARLENLHRLVAGDEEAHERGHEKLPEDGERPEAVEGLTRAQIADRLHDLASELHTLRRLL
jgi:hypothetical protein